MSPPTRRVFCFMSFDTLCYMHPFVPNGTFCHSYPVPVYLGGGAEVRRRQRIGLMKKPVFQPRTLNFDMT